MKKKEVCPCGSLFALDNVSDVLLANGKIDRVEQRNCGLCGNLLYGRVRRLKNGNNT